MCLISSKIQKTFSAISSSFDCPVESHLHTLKFFQSHQPLIAKHDLSTACTNEEGARRSLL